MRIAGPALHVSLLLAVAGGAQWALTGCATNPQDAETPKAPESQVESSTIASNEGSTTDTTDVIERAGAPLAALGQGSSLGQDAELLSLKEQKQRLLYDAAMARAEEFKDRLQFAEAKTQVERALELEPDSLAARKLRSELAALMGEPGGSTFSDDVDQYKLKLEQIRLEVKQDLNDAKIARNRGDYGAAVADLQLAKTKIEVNGFDIEWNGLDQEVLALLDTVKAERMAAEEQAVQDERAEAFSQLKAQESMENDRKEQIVNNILTNAMTAFEEGRYRDAEEYAQLAMQKQPKNEKADEIRTAAFRAGRSQVQDNYLKAKKEQFTRWRAELEQMRIPQNQELTLPDSEVWRANAERRKDRTFNATRNVSIIERDLREQIATSTVALPSLDTEDLNVVANFVRDSTNLPIVVDQAAATAAEEEGAVFAFNFENDLTVEQALNRITAAAGEGVTWMIKYDSVLITTKEKALGNPIPVVHPVQDLTFALTDFWGPRIDRIRLIDELEDDDGGGPFGTVQESQRIITLDDLQTLIQDTVAPEAWDAEGVSIELGEGSLIVTHTPEIQQKIRDFLEDLRKFNSAMVTIESKFLEVTDNWIQEIGNDFRGLDNRVLEDVTNGLEDMASRGLDNGGSGTGGTNSAGSPSSGFFFDDGQDGAFAATTQNFFNTALGSSLSTLGGMTFQMTFFDDSEVSSILRAVEKSEQSQVVNSQMLSVNDSQRAYVAVINQRAYIQDFDVEVAQFQAVADPVVNVLNEGVVLDVRPTILDNRKWLRLEIQPTVARIVSLRAFSTTLGGNTAPVEFQLPELQVQSVNTSAFLPDGGSLMLGGLSRIRNIERRAEVPWLGKIPLLGFLFKTEGYNDERDSLMILVTARITDVRESVQKALEQQY
ncbi:Type IV pilus biogenesis and competence protein PilQ precursor [Planctomycetes bacterium Poly30]|uniref:Type IV pilus biogenesis and competence protein PilQ n=1 Tax=Saltatorellus ferox TaxID=2528018 RepID=A0A518EVX1_9BACT|nr:Type IV pilus biogenesis and competence protein PilQ precursor [Planctomycetes bacterium Poly30]